MLAYVRAISDVKGNWRVDQNLVANFRINKLLRIEGGLRYGERPHHFNSYYHYKLELQTKWFYNIFRIIGRISDNVILYPDPYRKTNEIIAAESRYKLSESFTLLASCGYVFSATEMENTEAWPTLNGRIKNYAVWKTGLRYRHDRIDLETTYGSYDTFNPYEPDQPFLQETGFFEITENYSIYGNFRYQFNKNPGTPLNYFFGAGVRLRIN
ncbi:MAG: hypothetical protein ABJA70_11320 [Chryseolinea sp.]